ncbi:transglycosylase family protein [Nocardioides montaniterrae]
MRTILGILVTSIFATVMAIAPSADAATTRQWYRVANCESSLRWHINTGNGYYGGLQISDPTWRAYGGRTYSRHASGTGHWHQIRIAKRILHGQGKGAWGYCGRFL